MNTTVFTVKRHTVGQVFPWERGNTPGSLQN